MNFLDCLMLLNQWVALPRCRRAHYLPLSFGGTTYCGAGGAVRPDETSVAPADMPRCQHCQRSLAWRAPHTGSQDT